MPLFLGGDWNDGMNRVGIGGKGTSVWLGWFLAGALRSFSTFAAERGDNGPRRALEQSIRPISRR